jgi:topoisomerase-4 subunit B
MAVPPLYSIRQGGKIAYARDDAHKDELLRTEFTGRAKVEIGRFKGLGEMMASQLKETTMDPRKRTLLRVDVNEVDSATKDRVDELMGTKPEARFRFIQERAEFAEAEVLDI